MSFAFFLCKIMQTDEKRKRKKSNNGVQTAVNAAHLVKQIVNRFKKGESEDTAETSKQKVKQQYSFPTEKNNFIYLFAECQVVDDKKNKSFDKI